MSPTEVALGDHDGPRGFTGVGTSDCGGLRGFTRVGIGGVRGSGSRSPPGGVWGIPKSASHLMVWPQRGHTADPPLRSRCPVAPAWQATSHIMAAAGFGRQIFNRFALAGVAREDQVGRRRRRVRQAPLSSSCRGRRLADRGRYRRSAELAKAVEAHEDPESGHREHTQPAQHPVVPTGEHVDERRAGDRAGRTCRAFGHEWASPRPDPRAPPQSARPPVRRPPVREDVSSASAAFVVCGLPEKNDDAARFWTVECAATTENILLAVNGLGLGAVWTAVHPIDPLIHAVREIWLSPRT